MFVKVALYKAMMSADKKNQWNLASVSKCLNIERNVTT